MLSFALLSKVIIWHYVSNVYRTEHQTSATFKIWFAHWRMWLMFWKTLFQLTFLPIWTPGVSASTMKPVKALLAGHLGSELVRASRKYLKVLETKLPDRSCCSNQREKREEQHKFQHSEWPWGWMPFKTDHYNFNECNTSAATVSTHQLAFPPLVIHIFCPLTTYSSPIFTARVWMPATSDPAPGSVTQYACRKPHRS